MGQLDREQWQRTYQAIKRQARRLKKLHGPLRGSIYSDVLIGAMYFWTVLHDRPLCWAADADHYDRRLFRPRMLPSRSQFGRRVDSQRFNTFLTLIHQDLLGPLERSDGGILDGKPLTLGVASKDKDARRGKVMGGFAKGYKLHVWITMDRRIALWSLMPLNVAEQNVAEELLRRMPGFTAGAVTLGDGSYDSQRLYQGAADRNTTLLCKPRGMDLQDAGAWLKKQSHKHPKTKPDSPARAQSLALWKDSSGLARYVYGDRVHVEGTLSNLCSHGGGLGPLPAFVRRLRRVRRWVGTKIILYHARLQGQHAIGRAA